MQVQQGINCPECHAHRTDTNAVCQTCGAPPIRPGEQRAQEEEVRTQDLEPYVALRYIARLFKVLAVLMIVMMIGEVVSGLMADAAASLPILIGEVTQMLVLAGLMWGIGDITVLLIDLGHDIRVARILLGRINAEMHRRDSDVS
ncbi:MAG TPA: hypothetical protein VM779_03225 [Thermoanaerobaculia bacterium]|nr:hypothetical protein [Thermoanaerobaculia bacterium]